MTSNSLKARLAAGKKSYGVWTLGLSTVITETLGKCGYDFLFLDQEHGPLGLMETIPHLQTLAATNCPPVIRVPWNDPVYLKRILDAGVESIMVPMVETAEQAKAAVAACRYPPRGFRGFGPLRHLGTEPDIDAYGRTAHERLLLIVQIESEKAIANIDAIASVDGVDACYIGPNDLSGTLGCFREWEHPSLQKAIDTAFAGIKRAGKAAGIVPYGKNTVASLFKDGYTMIAAGTELTLMRGAAQADIAAIKKAMDKESSMDVRLDGRTALVTGGSKGLGLAMATEFARSGADVVIVARRDDVLKEAVASIGKVAKTRIHPVAADVATAAGTQKAYDAAMGAFGKIDILVNNAGKSQTAKFEEVTDAIWQDDLDLKLFAAIRLTRLALPGMKSRKWGRVINVLNTGAKTPGAGSAPTTVSRAAGLALTKVLAGEGAPHGVLVNALLVGLIESDQWVRRHKAEGANVAYEDFIKNLGVKLPLGRIGTAQEFANIASFLASDAGGYINGTAINVDGGASPVV